MSPLNRCRRFLCARRVGRMEVSHWGTEFREGKALFTVKGAKHRAVFHLSSTLARVVSKHHTDSKNGGKPYKTYNRIWSFAKIFAIYGTESSTNPEFFLRIYKDCLCKCRLLVQWCRTCVAWNLQYGSIRLLVLFSMHKLQKFLHHNHPGHWPWVFYLFALFCFLYSLSKGSNNLYFCLVKYTGTIAPTATSHCQCTCSNMWVLS